MSFYRIEATERFEKDLKILSHTDDPRSKGKALKGNLIGL